MSGERTSSAWRRVVCYEGTEWGTVAELEFPAWFRHQTGVQAVDVRTPELKESSQELKLLFLTGIKMSTHLPTEITSTDGFELFRG